MFDPEMNFDQRLAVECGYVSDGFYPKADCDEQELKYLVLGTPSSICDKIRKTIHEKPSRLVDFRAWTQNPYALITLNLDTEDQQLAKAGFSLRVRFALTGNSMDEISSIDMCIKTRLPSGTKIIPFQQTRGEWEVSLDSLHPNMDKMIAAHAKSKPPLPAIFMDDSIRNADFFIKTIGGTLRSVYPSYEGFSYKGKQVAAEFQHTEDVKNIFMTPYADIVTGQDSEVEAEFIGIRGITPDEVSPEDFDKVMRKSMKLLDKTIRGADPFAIQPNLISKSGRASNALETVYTPPPQTGVKGAFDQAGRVFQAADLALSLKVRPEEASLDQIWYHIGHQRAKFEREKINIQNPFEMTKTGRWRDLARA